MIFLITNNQSIITTYQFPKYWSLYRFSLLSSRFSLPSFPLSRFLPKLWWWILPRLDPTPEDSPGPPMAPSAPSLREPQGWRRHCLWHECGVLTNWRIKNNLLDCVFQNVEIVWFCISKVSNLKIWNFEIWNYEIRNLKLLDLKISNFKILNFEFETWREDLLSTAN